MSDFGETMSKEIEEHFKNLEKINKALKSGDLDYEDAVDLIKHSPFSM